MNWRSHVISTLIFALIFIWIANTYLGASLQSVEMAQFAIIAAASALIPDIDTPESRISKIAFPLAIVAICAFTFGLLGVNTPSILITILSLLFIYAVYKFIVKRHRGNTHSWMFAFVFALPVWLKLGMLPAMAVMFGYTGHLIQDAICDKTGIGK